MNIGIDIDGVLTDIERMILDYGSKLCVDENWPINLKLGEYDETKEFGWTAEQSEKFWNTYWIKYVIEGKTREFAQKIIEKLQKDGHKIFFITARNEENMPLEYSGKIQELTKKWLENQNIKYEKIIFSADSEKLSKCLENNVEVMIEDSPSNIEYISKKIKVIKIDCQYNRHINGANVITAYSWYHIYKIIKEWN